MIATLSSDNAALGWIVNKLPWAASIFAVILLAFALANIAWLLLAPPPPYQPIQTSRSVITAPTQEDDVEIDLEVAGLHLFGEADVPELAVSQNAPETRLNLRLIGMLATDDDSAYAIIASGNSPEQFYRVGSDIPGGAKLTSVQADRILLSRGGRIETLRLPRKRIEGFVESELADPSQTQQAPDSSSLDNNPNNPEVDLGQLRQQMLKNPQRLGEMIAVSPEKTNGQFTGFRVTPRGNDKLFSQLGLQPGDLVTSINGIDLNAPQQGLAALQDLTDAEDITLTLLRDGNEVTLFQSFER